MNHLHQRTESSHHHIDPKRLKAMNQTNRMLQLQTHQMVLVQMLDRIQNPHQKNPRKPRMIAPKVPPMQIVLINRVRQAYKPQIKMIPQKHRNQIQIQTQMKIQIILTTAPAHPMAM